ncbi:clock-controlled protein-like protein 8 [Mollisia scopiformis]|uniref:Clock-controlled protein-like protein 8 n=1 Tax=Mollisia scopiformis TaxID=149040 RepID=A0A194XBJ9_MOLSC|nr:clock-controlled protein-like protein 8 [Mollisia scopiformis]KUJ17538.1 clock-controlled protein-like protein 8 [Mollisia scopiformis]
MEQDHMLREEPPSYTQSHDPQSLNFPSVPTADPPPVHHARTLPPLPPAPAEPRYRQEEHPFVWPSSNPLTAYYQPGPSALSPKTGSSHGMDSPKTMDMDTPDSRGRRGGSVLSIDDPDVRLAAEALGDLRADFIQSPPQRHQPLPASSPNYQSGNNQQPEPLLSLLTTSHPLIGTAIGGSLSAYSASKNFSPRFKSGAEYVERRFTPVVNTVGSVGRMTGVEGGVRWFLGGRRPSHHQPSDLENNEGSNKRRKVDNDDTDTDRNVSHDPYPVHRQELQHRQRRPSQASTVESLPAYDEHRSPNYEATQQALIPTQTQEEPTSPGSSWQSRLVLSTSGLSVAMSEESLRSLKYCLSWLRWANEHIGKVILALKSVLEQYDRDGRVEGTIEGSGKEGQLVLRSEADRSALNAKITDLKKDVLKTLKEVVDIVSKYAGGALPENARILVRRHLTSLPQRFRLASSRNGDASKNGETDVTEGANRVLVLAKEGLDMMAQVSGVLDGTIVSAEEWCERLGRSKRGEPEGESNDETPMEKPPLELPPMNGYANGNPDVKMT